MRDMLDLLDLPYIFDQHSLLTTDQFIKEYNKRIGVFGNKLKVMGQLEALHKFGVLVPIYRFQRNVDFILEQCNKNGYEDYQTSSILDRIPREDYRNNELGVFKNPHNESFQDWRNYKRKIGNYHYTTSSFLYSPYQLLLSYRISSIIGKMTSNPLEGGDPHLDREFTINKDNHYWKWIENEIEQNNKLVFILSTLENLSLPKLRGHWYLAHYSSMNNNEIINYIQVLDRIKLFDWLGSSQEELRDLASYLLHHASMIDPMDDWHKLIQLCHPDKWKTLKGEPLLAFDHRLAAEILLRFYEDLVKLQVASPLSPEPRYARGPYHHRLRPEPSTLNKVLMDFGISPVPSLLLILEGDTEAVIVPKVMEILGIPQHDNLIKIFNIEGVTRDFELLARFIAVPNLGEPIERMILLDSPPTTFFVVTDAESKFTTSHMRKIQRENWVNGIYKNIPKEHRNKILKNQIKTLVRIDTWKNTIFEYAHFTNSELAYAIRLLDDFYKNDSESSLIARIQQARKEKRNLDSIWKKDKRSISKVDLANSLWPVLERKIRNSKNPIRIPIVRILYKVENIAIRTHRKDVGILSAK